MVGFSRKGMGFLRVTGRRRFDLCVECWIREVSKGYW